MILFSGSWFEYSGAGMKRILLSILFLVVIVASVEAKTITLSRCSPSGAGMEDYEKNDFVIYLDNNITKHVKIYTDKAVEQHTQNRKKLGISEAVEKIKINEYKIVYSDSQFVKASRKIPIMENRPEFLQFDLDIDLKKKTLDETTYTYIKNGLEKKYTIPFKCEKSSGGSGAKRVLDKILR